jgi:hypothetical protein
MEEIDTTLIADFRRTIVASPETGTSSPGYFDAKWLCR